DELLTLAASVERHSEHHLGEAIIQEAQRRGLSLRDIDEFENHTGQGVHALVDGLWVGIGREAMFRQHGLTVPAQVEEAAQTFRQAGQTALIVLAREAREASPRLAGVVAVADVPRPQAQEAIASLKRLGIRQVVVLTGDHHEVAQAVAKAVGADQVRAGLMPQQKVMELRKLMSDGAGVAMVGDGVNDAPALATATVGIAMGGAGTDVALETADVVLMGDDLRALPFAVWLSRRARQRIRQNMTFAFSMIGLLVLLSFWGLPLWLGVIGHEGSTLLVVLNGLRILVDRPGVSESPGVSEIQAIGD
ncbi:MAG TPA: HAD-IC family P-type ATPase, partial [Phycisphaeraceae bacterium]